MTIYDQNSFTTLIVHFLKYHLLIRQVKSRKHTFWNMSNACDFKIKKNHSVGNVHMYHVYRRLLIWLCMNVSLLWNDMLIQ